jgi:Zn-dependent protease with chaperone function
MANTLKARLYDGIHSTAQDATVEVLDSCLKISYEKEGVWQFMQWDKDKLQVMEMPHHDKPGVLGCKSYLGARLIIKEKDFFDTIIPLVPKKQIKRSHVHHPWRILMILVLIAGVVLGILSWAIPKGASWIARMMPESFEQVLWDNWIEYQVVISTDLMECVDPKGFAALQKLVAKMEPFNHPNIDVRVLYNSQVNAVTYPNHRIFIFDGLIQNVPNVDALAGILAHEMGHDMRHHPTAAVLNYYGVTVFWYLAFRESGDYGPKLLWLKYSREFEDEADEIATELLKKANVSDEGLITYFQRSLDQIGDAKGFSKYLSTHPVDKDRISHIKATKDVPFPRPSLNEQDWQDLKGICKKQRKIVFKKK